MAQPGHHGWLAFKAVDEICVFSQLAVEHFNGHVAVQARLIGLVNIGHTSPAQPGQDMVFSKGFIN
jgi:hypothetical protein